MESNIRIPFEKITMVEKIGCKVFKFYKWCLLQQCLAHLAYALKQCLGGFQSRMYGSSPRHIPMGKFGLQMHLFSFFTSHHNLGFQISN